MFDEEEKPKSDNGLPRNLESLSVSELEEYINDLKAEIKRAETDIENKKAQQDAAAKLFS